MTAADDARAHIPKRGRVARAMPLVGLAGRTAGEAVVESMRRRRKNAEAGRPDYRVKDADRYANHLGRSKGVLMKAGQILSFTAIGPTVGDENQNVYQRALARLQDSAPPMPYETAAGVIEANLGKPVDELFAEFDPVPVGAASIGQVHAARLTDGRRVAVKVQYPGVDEAIRADLANTELLATFFQMAKGLQPALARLDIKALSQEVTARIGEEIDYLVEAANQTAFVDGYRGHPFIRIPEVVPELTTSQVLTMDFVEGRRFAEALTAPQELRDLWGETISRFAMGSLRTIGLFNADPHPGNYLFHDDGGVTFIDFGCVKRFTEDKVTLVKRSLNAAVEDDVPALMLALRDMGIVVDGELPEPREIADFYRCGLEMLTGPQPFTYSTAFAAGVVQDKFSPVGPYGHVLRKVSLDPDFTMLTRIDLGVTAVLGALECTGPWEAIRQEWDNNGPAATPMGELDIAHWGAKR